MVKGKASAWNIEVFDLIYYLLPPNQDFLSTKFSIKDDIIEKIKNYKINYIICKPIRDIILFDYATEIQNYISLNILKWCFDNIDKIQHGEAEPIYTSFFIENNINVPLYSEISDVLLDITSKNPNIISDLESQTESNLQEILKDQDDWLEEWFTNYECHYSFGRYLQVDFNNDEISEIENQFEGFKYPDVFEMKEKMLGNAIDYIWKLIYKEKDKVTSTRSAEYKNLMIACDVLKLLKVDDTTFSLIDENNLHRNYKKLESEIDKISDKVNILEILNTFRLNKCGMSVYFTSLGLFYLYQKRKIKFYNADNEPITQNTKISNKVILGKSLNFINSLVNKQGKLGKVELFDNAKWIYIIEKIVIFKDEKLMTIELKYEDETPIDLDSLMGSQSFDREQKLLNIMKKFSSITELIELDTNFNLFLTRLNLQKNKNVKAELGLNFFIELFKKLKNISDIELFYNFLHDNDEEITSNLIKFKITKHFFNSKLSTIEGILDKIDLIMI